MRIAVIAGALLLAACGQEDPSADRESARQPAGSGEADPATPVQTAGEESTGPVLTEVPDPCEILTRADAEALLGEPVGEGMSFDAGGWNCVYDTGAPRRRLVFDMYVGRDATVESTQVGMTIEACGAEVAARYPDLGTDAALYRNTNAECGIETFLWVATGVRFQGKMWPGMARETRGQIHLNIFLSPAGDEFSASEVMRGAARRALARLEG